MEDYIQKYGNPEFLPTDEIERLADKVIFLQIEENRKMAYYEYGDANGIPIIFFHGTGSHIHAALLHTSAIKYGFRIIVPDRPGIGRSDFKENWTLLGYMDDIKKLADHLGLEKFIAMGISGGGPTLMACAYIMHDRVTTAVDLACAMPLYSDKTMLSQLGTVDRLFAKIGPKIPLWLFQIPFSLLGFQQKIMKNPESFAKMMSSSMCEADRIIFSKPEFQYLFMRDFQELFRQGSKGPSYDAQCVYKDWGFDIADIKIPIQIFQGTDDKWIPQKFSEYLAEKCSNAELHLIEGAGHFHHVVHSDFCFETIKNC